jgi:hypothetical protein
MDGWMEATNGRRLLILLPSTVVPYWTEATNYGKTAVAQVEAGTEQGACSTNTSRCRGRCSDLSGRNGERKERDEFDRDSSCGDWSGACTGCGMRCRPSGQELYRG